MFESFAHFMLEEHLCAGTFVPPTGPLGYPRQLDPNRQPFPTADGYLSIVPYTDDSIVRIFHVLGAPEVLEREPFTSPRGRGLNVSYLYAEIARLTPARTSADWLERLRAAEIPALAVCDLQDVPNDPHLRASGFITEREHPSEGRYLDMRPPVRFGARYSPAGRPAPLLGEHTEEVRAQLDSTR
jgi:crotonobetainyl-CoA:carnitine CoA-transferase CaiB-like acyl-CoA transferase